MTNLLSYINQSNTELESFIDQHPELFCAEYQAHLDKMESIKKEIGGML